MGVNGLRKLIERYAPGAIRTGVPLSEFAGGMFVIDASLRIFKWTLARGGDVAYEDRLHVTGVFSLTTCLRAAGIRSLYVFDGAPPAAKAATLEARAATRTKSPDTRVWAETRELLDILGVQHVTANGEADPLVAAYTRDDTIRACALTDDLDALAFGARDVILDLDCVKRRATVINYASVLEEMGLTHSEFIDLCILCGCDYSEKVKGVAAITALKRIREYRTIEAFSATLSAENASFLRSYPIAREVFNAPTIVEIAIAADGGIPDKARAAAWLAERGVANKKIAAALA